MTVTEAKNNFDKLIELATHEPVTLMHHNHPITIIRCNKPELKDKNSVGWFGKAAQSRNDENYDRAAHSKKIEEMVQSIRDERDKWDN